MPNQELRARGPWTCAACSKQFQFSRKYSVIVFWGALGLTAVLFYALGLRDLRLFAATIILFFPIFHLCMFFIIRIQPLPLEPYEPKSWGGDKGGTTLFPK
jgi:hypothetical protein